MQHDNTSLENLPKMHFLKFSPENDQKQIKLAGYQCLFLFNDTTDIKLEHLTEAMIDPVILTLRADCLKKSLKA